LRRFVVDDIPPSAHRVFIKGATAKHIAKVLRMEPGDELAVLDQKGSRYRGRIASVNPSTVEVDLLYPLPAPQESPLQLILCQAILKAKNMDLVIQKATELGVSTLIPFYSERTVARIDPRNAENKLRHWNEVARNATEQSDRARPPQIQPVTDLAHVLAMGSDPKSLKIILWEQERARYLRRILRDEPPTNRVIAVVGPEGGFSRRELTQAMEAGFTPVSLGARILRAETAAIVLAALCQYQWGDLGLLPTW